jgi:alpha-glucosidase
MPDDFSYALVMKPEKDNYPSCENDDTVTITMPEFAARIKKNPFRVEFVTHNGQIINCDEPGLLNSFIDGVATSYKSLQKGERFIGLGAKCGGLDKTGKGYINLNTDAFAYGVEQDPLYSSLPFYIGIHNGMAYGIFLDSSCRTDFNFGASNRRFSSFSTHNNFLDYYFIYHTDIADIVKSYSRLTGYTPLPPLWSLGYQQNRYSYYPDVEVLRIASTLREKQIPCDGITLDIHHMDKYKLFTWDGARFPNPQQLTDRLKDLGFHTTIIVDPGVKSEDAYEVYERGKREDIFIKYTDGVDYEAEVWAGWSVFPDFTCPKARKWWADELQKTVAAGIDGIWNDMNEIATWGNKLPDNLVFDYEGQKSFTSRARNVYGMQMARASYEGFCASEQNRRPFILTRAAYAGVQRYSAVWTGDNTASPEHLMLGLRMLMGMGLCGVPFTGMDIGGFLGEASVELYVRWMQIGAFTPYMRNHKQVNTKSGEPWTYGEEATEIIRNFINLRYRLMPYIYSLFYEASQNGMPLMRTLALRYPHDERVYDACFENQYEFGDAFMIAPFASGKYGEIYFPSDKRYDFYNDTQEDENTVKILKLDNHKLPVYVRESSIVPMQSPVQHTGETPADRTLYLHIYKGKTYNRFVYYEDDGETFDYENGAYFKRGISFNPSENKLILEDAEGSHTSKFAYIKLILHGFESMKSAKYTVAGTSHLLPLVSEFVSFIEPVSSFEPQAPVNLAERCPVKCATIDNCRNEIEIIIR